MKTVIVKRKHWEEDAQGDPQHIEYELELGETLEEAISASGEAEVLFAYQTGAKGIIGTRLQALCMKGKGGIRSSPSLSIEEVLEALTNGIPLAPARETKSESQKCADYIASLPLEERKAAIAELTGMLTPMLEGE